ncbi:unnamed protein product [Boreogadus saida]
MFPQLTDYLHANNLSVAAVKEVATSHLTALSKHFKSYFADVNTDAWDWVRDPFAPGVTCSGLTSKAEDELVDLSCDRTLKARFQQNAGLLRGKVVEPAVWNMDPKEQQELLERIQDTDEEEKYPLLFTFDFQEDMEEVFHNMAAEEDLRVNAMFLGRWVDSQ